MQSFKSFIDTLTPFIAWERVRVQKGNKLAWPEASATVARDERFLLSKDLGIDLVSAKDFDALTKILEGSNAGRNKIFHNSIEGTLDNPDPVLGGVKKIKLSKTSRADDKPYSVNLKEIKNASALCRSAIAACWAFRVKIVRSQFAQHNTSPEKSP